MDACLQSSLVSAVQTQTHRGWLRGVTRPLAIITHVALASQGH